MTDEDHHIARQAAALDDPGVRRSQADLLAANLREIVSEAEKDRDRFAHIAATIRVNALRGGATTEEAEAMVRGDKSFIDWLADRFSRPSQARNERVARLVKEYRPTMDAEVLHSWARDVVAALAAMDTPKGGGDEWQPISITPDAPTAVLLFFGDATWWQMDMDPPRDERFDVGAWDGEYWRENGTGHDLFEDWRGPEQLPTHWMPLPAPPAAMKDGGTDALEAQREHDAGRRV